MSAAEEALKAGDPHGALKLLQEQIRSHPADAKLRVFLFGASVGVQPDHHFNNVACAVRTILIPIPDQ